MSNACLIVFVPPNALFCIVFFVLRLQHLNAEQVRALRFVLAISRFSMLDSSRKKSRREFSISYTQPPSSLSYANVTLSVLCHDEQQTDRVTYNVNMTKTSAQRDMMKGLDLTVIPISASLSTTIAKISSSYA